MALTPEQLKNIDDSSYGSMVRNLTKSGEDILAGLTAEKVDLLHMAIGIAGEAGELLDAIKKHVIYGKPMDRANLIEELGDLEFYLNGIRFNQAVSRTDVLLANKRKLLGGRYVNGTYSDAQAVTRADKE